MNGKIDIENVVLHLFEAYPNANYIALNTGLTFSNQEFWDSHWYFVGFEDMPVYKGFEGYPAWVASDDVELLDDEWGLFFLHISSKDHEFRGVPIQKTKYDFASPRFFCWKRCDDGKIQEIISEEIEGEDPKTSADLVKRTKDFLDAVVAEPAAYIIDNSIIK